MDAFPLRTPNHIALPVLWDSHETRHFEWIQRIQIAQKLYKLRETIPEAEGLHKEYVQIQKSWIAEQHAIDEQDFGVYCYSYGGNSTDIFPKGCVCSSSISSILKINSQNLGVTAKGLTSSTSRSINPLTLSSFPGNRAENLPETFLETVPPPTHCPNCHGPDIISHNNEMTLTEKIRRAAKTEMEIEQERAAKNEAAKKLNPFPAKPTYPEPLDDPDTICHGKVRRILSHRAGRPGYQVYTIEWIPYDLDCEPVTWQGMDIPPWPKKRDPVSSASLGVRHIKKALEDRKLDLKKLGFPIKQQEYEIIQEKWSIRDQWQRIGRGWGSARQVVRHHKDRWMEDKFTKELIAQHLEVEEFSKEYDLQGIIGGMISKRRSEPNLYARARVLNDTQPECLVINRRFSEEDEREWREHFSDMIAGLSNDNAGKGSLGGVQAQPPELRNAHSLPRVMSTLRRDHLRISRPFMAEPGGFGRNSSHVGSDHSQTELDNTSGPPKKAVADSSNTEKSLFYGLFRRLSRGRLRKPQSNATGTQLPAPLNGKLSPPRHNFRPTNRTYVPLSEANFSCLDGASHSNDEDDLPLMQSAMTITNQDTPNRGEKPPQREQREDSTFVSFPGYEAAATTVAAPYFCYRPRRLTCTDGCGNVITRDESGNTCVGPEVHHHHHYHSHQHHHYHSGEASESQAESVTTDDEEDRAESSGSSHAIESIEGAGRELWLDGALEAESCRPEIIRSESNSGKTTILNNFFGSCTRPRRSGSIAGSSKSSRRPSKPEKTDDSNEEGKKTSWSDLLVTASNSSSSSLEILEEEEEEEENFSVIKRKAIKELPVLLCPYCHAPLGDLTHACRSVVIETTQRKEPTTSVERFRDLRSQVCSKEKARRHTLGEESHAERISIKALGNVYRNQMKGLLRRLSNA
ncbi:hypothetical protein FPQ18DRAFT_406784 [Pyronema domesticum]|nr:hypothetical protein FPQ18DRAFT_406784 [Pyronema domesticum]